MHANTSTETSTANPLASRRVCLFALLTLAAVGCDAFGGSNADSGTSENAIKVLACNPITGSLSFMGPSLERSMDLAVREINVAGGVLGRPISLIAADTHSDEDAGLAEAQFYFRRDPDIAAIVGASLDSVSKKLLVDIAKDSFNYEYKTRIPMVSPASTSVEFVGLLDAQYNLFFRTVCSSHLEGTILADKAEEMGFKIGAVVGIKDINNNGIAKAFRERFDQLGDEYRVTEHLYDHGTVVDINEAFVQAYAATQQRYGSEPDFLLVLAYGNDGKIALNQWARKHADTPLLLSDSLMSDYFLGGLDPKTLTALEDGTINGVFPRGSAAGRGAGIFSESFCSQYPQHCQCEAGEQGEKNVCTDGEGLQPGIYTANAYDAIYMLALGFADAANEDASSIDRKGGWDVDRVIESILRVTNPDTTDDVNVYPGEWAKALEAIRAGQGVNYEGASSTALDVDRNGDPVNCSFSFWSVINGQVVFRNSDGQKESVTVSL